MKINSLKIYNFRSYEKETTFDFSGEKAINILIGENGSGKTSLLNAIKYVLFGSEMFGSTYFTKEYTNWIKSEINMNSAEQFFTVEIDFEDENHNVVVSRKSEIINGKIHEKCNIEIDGQRQKNSDFLNRYNYSLFNNIFFDGEKISLLSQDAKRMKSFVTEMIDVYFELDVFEQIIKDANKAISNNIKEIATTEFKAVEKELQRIDSKISKNENTISRITNEIERNELILESVLEEMNSRNMLTTKDSKSIELELKNLKAEIEQQNTEVSQFFKTSANQMLMKNAIDRINGNLMTSRNERAAKIARIFKKLQTGSVESYTEISLEHELEIASRSASNLAKEIENCRKMATRLQANKRKYDKLQKRLAQSDEGKKYIDFNSNADMLQEQITSAKENLKLVREKQVLKEIERKQVVERLEREQKKMLDDMLVANAIKEKQKLVKVTEEYIEKRRKLAFDIVAGSMEEILKEQVLRKAGLVDSIIIKDYQVQILAKGHVRNISSFSSGEQQLFIVGFILAVLKQAHIRVPLLLDTFFGRLDVDHQMNLLSYMNTFTDNQLVFIATDSELTLEKRNQIIGNTNRIIYLKNEGYNTIMEVEECE